MSELDSKCPFHGSAPELSSDAAAEAAAPANSAQPTDSSSSYSLMNPTRRDAIKFLVGGAVVAACPSPIAAMQGSPAPSAGAASSFSSEINKICHMVRDGEGFQIPAPSAQVETVIIGGGPSGMIAAYRMQGRDFLLLEKEPRLGGNAIPEKWNDLWYATGSAYNANENLKGFAMELGMDVPLIQSVDACIYKDQLTPEFWKGGIAKSNYSDAAKKNFDKFFKDMKAMNLDKLTDAEKAKLDAIAFSDLIEPYGPEVKAWFDNFGPNNWGAVTEDTSALIGAEVVDWVGGLEEGRYTWEGGLGRISLVLEAALMKTSKEKLQRNATVIQIEQKGDKVLVTYSQDDKLKTVAAKAAVMACPKFIGKHLIKGIYQIDQEHADAMDEMRYQPYLVVNLCYNSVVYNGSYDTNIPAPCVMTDFVVADWVSQHGNNKETKRPQVLSCYVPRAETQRAALLKDEFCVSLGQKCLDQMDVWFPGSKAKAAEVRVFRRGHPMFLSAPGVTTRVAPKLRKPMGNIFFAHSDTEGGVTEFATALQAADRVTKEVTAYLGKKAARESVRVTVG